MIEGEYVVGNGVSELRFFLQPVNSRDAADSDNKMFLQRCDIEWKLVLRLQDNEFLKTLLILYCSSILSFLKRNEPQL